MEQATYVLASGFAVALVIVAFAVPAALTPLVLFSVLVVGHFVSLRVAVLP